MRRSKDKTDGFTLLELAGVAVLLGLLTALTVRSFSATSDASKRRQFVAELRDLDARGRLHARTNGPVVLLPVTRSRHERTLELQTWPMGERLAEVRLAPDTAVELHDRLENGWLLFDRAGTTVDYAVVVKQGTELQRWRISGATGWIAEEGAE